MRRRGLQPFVWPLALLAVAVGLIGAAQGLAAIDGFRLYGTVQAFGEIVGVIGAAWLIVVVARTILDRRGRGR